VVEPVRLTRRAAMTHVRSLDHIGINVDDLEAATEFFLDLGLEIEGTGTNQGDWVGDIIGLRDVNSDLVFLSTPDGSSKIELVKFHTPADNQGPEAAASNRLGIRHLSFVVDDLNALLENLRAKGFNTMGTVHDYENIFRLCFLRGPEGIIVEMAERIDGEAEERTSRDNVD
jgi:catechol 2,3-dioxygenase-like lactoylglutathione lyase family enzyme